LRFAETASLHLLSPQLENSLTSNRGRFRGAGHLDNIFIERSWRSLKQEAIHLEESIDGFQAQRVVKNWMAFYNAARPQFRA
ncbi:integrase core domain-containing protein, partial [Jannaschia aquimarina]|uniref:integrase core domain-containing protein n=1 Tax=Jannaschia aquimarina TaxID=935700 RepID=UPI001BAEFB3B